MGQQQIKVKMVKPPAKVQIPQGQEQEEEEPEEEPSTVKKPVTRGATKAAQEAEAKPAQEAAQGGPVVVRSSNPPSRKAEPSREIRNIIRMYQSRPAPVPVPVQLSRWDGPGVVTAACSPRSHSVDS